MALATLTTKGQVTVPKSVRDALHLRSGDKLEFIITDNGGIVLRPVTRKVDDVFGRLQRHGQKPISVEAMDQAVRRRMRKAFK